jgi:hypothetical protein
MAHAPIPMGVIYKSLFPSCRKFIIRIPFIHKAGIGLVCSSARITAEKSSSRPEPASAAATLAASTVAGIATIPKADETKIAATDFARRPLVISW